MIQPPRNKCSVLVVDDREKVCQTLVKNFLKLGYNAAFVTSGSEVLHTIRTKQPDTVLLDIMLGHDNGIDILKMVKQENPALPVIMITGYASIDSAVQSLRCGAYDYVQKPLEFEELREIVDRAAWEYSSDKPETVHKLSSPKLVTRNKEMLAIIERIDKLAPTDLPILILGENGTGKELVADRIHQKSKRSCHQMLKINCAALPESLLDNELFGHEKGSYTGAESAFMGVFEKADGSSLMLDEIGDMTLSIQAKILRTLQHNEIRRIGGTKTISINVRFIAATNKDIDSLIKEGEFRQDLFYRLNTATIKIPPLRDRIEDIFPLAQTFLERYSVQKNTNRKTLTSDAADALIKYNWPGNIRELKNIIEYSAAITESDIITGDDLPPQIRKNDTKMAAVHDPLNIRETMERDLIQKTLQKTLYNKSETARILKMSRRTLYNKIQRYTIDI
ncbi:sigma-54 dependent transcriptional regulator [Marispirochaeta sp.]|uniref:sigma-54-dependent transcriptional regulator n=1 Tax=Marispirochaeta sp. TaxID=2038653 RepID=UPI0029C94BCB|nr:sigma-54 dependent transcriptional regulator [Marispirochaeta sp.]